MEYEFVLEITGNYHSCDKSSLNYGGNAIDDDLAIEIPV